MAIITFSNIKKAFGVRELFEDVSFFVNEHERVALIGANGTGKTTLLKILCGEMQADSGSISKETGVTIGYLPQEVDLPEVAGLHLAVMGVTPELLACASELAILQKRVVEASGDEANGLGARYAEVSHTFDTLNGFDYQAKARAILQGLGFDDSEFDKPVHALSGGQKTRAALARLLLLSPDILVLDEPTNHLDIRACEWLQDFLQTRYQGAVLIVSHDRYFMDQVVSKVFELENGVIIAYPGNYSAFAHQKAEKIEEMRKAYKVQKKEIARIEQAIQTLFSDRKFSRRDSKIKQLERIHRIGLPDDQKTVKVNFSSAVRSGRDVVRLSKLTKSYPGKQLFSNASFTVERGQKIGIVGPNGSGKTTLLKIMADRELPDSGEVIFGHNVQPVYFAQEFDHLVPSRTVIEELLADADISSKEARDMLAQFLFLGDDAFKKVEVLSGGEMCRLALAKVLSTSPNLLLLDEPTNHLDIASREALESALQSFSGTVMVASHDRYLLNAITNQIIEIKDGEFTPYLGNYTNYREKAAEKTEQAAGVSAKGKSSTNAGKNAQEPLKPRPVSSLREMERQLRELGKEQRELEQQIETTETRMAEITEALGNEESYKNGSARGLSAEYDDLAARLHVLYGDWDHISEEMLETEDAIND